MGQILQALANRTLACDSNATSPAGMHQLTIRDINEAFMMNTNTVLAHMTLDQQLIKILDSIVPGNIFQSMENRNLLSVTQCVRLHWAIASSPSALLPT